MSFSTCKRMTPRSPPSRLLCPASGGGRWPTLTAFLTLDGRGNPNNPGRSPGSEFDSRSSRAGRWTSIDENPNREPPKRTKGIPSMDEYESLSRTKWECKYHVVFVPKCRRRTLLGQIRQHLGEVFSKVQTQKRYLHRPRVWRKKTEFRWPKLLGSRVLRLCTRP